MARDHGPVTMARRPTGFTLIELLVAIGIIATLIAFLLPALAAARTAARRAQSASQIRTIHQAMVLHAHANNQWYPGFDGRRFIEGGSIWIQSADQHGSTVAGRYAILIDADHLPTTQLISPVDGDKGAWIPNGPQYLGPSSYSYALLQINDDDGLEPTGSESRRTEWHATASAEAPVLGDRLIADDPDDIATWRSIHTPRPGQWRGHVAWNDNHVSFEAQPTLTRTRYGPVSNTADSLFHADPAKQQGPSDPAGNAHLVIRGADGVVE